MESVRKCAREKEKREREIGRERGKEIVERETES